MNKLTNYPTVVELPQNCQKPDLALNYCRIVKNLNSPHLDLKCIRSLCCHIDGPHVGKWVVLGFILDFKICMQDFIKCLGTYIGRTCSHQRLEHHLTSSTPDRLSGTDGLFKMGVNKVTKIKHKNKFMWSIKHQLTRSKCLPKLYSLAFHLQHYSPHCHINDM